MKKAEVAFTAMGTNCIPFLVNKARGVESPLGKLYSRIYPLMPTPLKSSLGRPRGASIIQFSAFLHLQKFPSTQLDPFVSTLMSIVPQIADDRVRSLAFEVVENSVLRTAKTEQQLQFFMTFLDDSDFRNRHQAAVIVAWLDNSITNGIPALTTALTDRGLIGAVYSGFKHPLDSPAYNSVIDNIQARSLGALARVAPVVAKEFEFQE